MADMKLSDLNSLASPAGTDLVAGVDVSNSNDVGHWTVDELATFIRDGRASLAGPNAFTGADTHAGNNVFNGSVNINDTATLGVATTSGSVSTSDRMNFSTAATSPITAYGLNVSSVNNTQLLIQIPESNSSTSSETVLRVMNSTNAANTGLQISKGGLRITTAGAGVTFPTGTAPATGSIATHTILDDYKEGTWTPDLTGGSAHYSNITFSNGRYTKTGRNVEVSGLITVGMGATNVFNSIIGLPYSAIANTTTGGIATVEEYVTSTSFTQRGVDTFGTSSGVSFTHPFSISSVAPTDATFPASRIIFHARYKTTS